MKNNRIKLSSNMAGGMFAHSCSAGKSYSCIGNTCRNTYAVVHGSIERDIG